MQNIQQSPYPNNNVFARPRTLFVRNALTVDVRMNCPFHPLNALYSSSHCPFMYSVFFSLYYSRKIY